MTVETRETVAAPARPAAKAEEELLREVPIIASNANYLAFPVRVMAIVSLAAGGVFWLLCFSHFLFDSFKSGLLCLGVLAAMVAPGWLLLRLHLALQVLGKLPARIPGLKGVVLVNPRSAAAAAPEENAFQRVISQMKTCFEAFIELRDHLSFAEENLAKVAGATSWVTFVTNPFQAVLLGVATGVSALLIIGAALAVVVTALRVILF